MFDKIALQGDRPLCPSTNVKVPRYVKLILKYRETGVWKEVGQECEPEPVHGTRLGKNIRRGNSIHYKLYLKQHTWYTQVRTPLGEFTIRPREERGNKRVRT
jgi:hypothetical protein